ncbi:MAG TPA: M14 family zinc carboxypeptidase [Solirubrobacteraceae bacterium]|jgi:protein MpaA
MLADGRRRRTAAAILTITALVALPATGRSAGPASAPAQRYRGDRHVIGHSVQGRPLVAWAYGQPTAPRKVLVIGVIHGNEQAGLAITRALRRQPVPRGVQLWVLPELNPDGVAADTRQNADGVDLNRNFPFRWRYSSDPTFDSGPRPASEPETRAAMRLVARIHPAVTITYHQHMDLVDESGGDRGIPRRYAQVAHLRATCLTFLPGEETAWSNHALPGTTSFVVELPAGPVGPAALARHLRAIRAVELGERTGPAHRCDSTTTAQ